MGKQLYLNNFESAFTSIVKDTPVTGTPATEVGYGILNLNNSTAAALANPTGGDFYLLTALKRSGSLESAIEIMKVTAVDTTTYPGECRITVLRAQEGTTAQAYLVGDIMSLRWTKGSASSMIQAAEKDASGGVPGLTLFKLNLRNAANTITSWFTTAATVARTWTMPDKDGTVAVTSDITGGMLAGSFTSLTLPASYAANINFGIAATGAPTFTTRSGGTKIVYYSSLSPSQADYAVGVDSVGNVWNSVQSTAQGWDWYGGITPAAHLAGDGLFTTVGGMQVKGPSLLGYGTGAGGTVTQATSKATSVTLNKPCGQITMHNAELAAGATVVFVVNNILVGAYDAVVVNPAWTNGYAVTCNNVQTGLFWVTVKNITVGSLSDSLQIKFSVIKGATS